MLLGATRSKVIRLIGAFLMMSIAVAVLQITRGNDAEVTAAILQKASEAAKAINSYAVVTTGIQIYDNGDVESGTSVVKVDLRTGTAEASVLDENGNVESKTIIVGETIYMSATVDPPTWYTMPNPTPLASVSGASASVLLDNMRASLTDVTKAGDQLQDGRTIGILRGNTDLTAKAAQLWSNWDNSTSEERLSMERPREQFLSGQESVELWFDVESNLLVRAIVTADFPRIATLPGYHFETTHEFSSFNEPFFISAPPASQVVAAPTSATPPAPRRE